MIRTQIVFDHRGKTPNGKTGPVEVRISSKGKTMYVPTGVRVLRSEFAFGTIINRVDCDEMNRQLAVILRRVTDVTTDMFEHGVPIDAAEVKRRVMVQKDEGKNGEVLAWIRSQLPLMRLREGTLKHYHPLLVRMEECALFGTWADMTTENVYKFDAFLHGLTKQQSDSAKKQGAKAEPLSDAAVYTYHKCLKALLNRAYKMGVIAANPYDRLKGEFSRGERETVDYLTEEEMAAFESIRPLKGSTMDVAHDLFIFQMYTGLSFSDMERFDKSQYRIVDGTWRNVGERVKTGVPFVSTLLPPVVAILDKYNGELPKMCNADYNRALKALGMACGISRPLHSHMGRHTFATYALRKGVKIENLARMLGHTNITQTQRYAKVVAQSVHDDFDKLAEALKK